MVRAKDGGRGSCYIFLTDSKVHDIPEGCDNKEPEPEPESAILDEVESKKDVPARDCETVDMFEGVA